MKTVHIFAFYLHNLLKNYRFFSTKFHEPQKYKIFTFWRGGWGCSSPLSVFRCSVSLLQMRNQFSSDFPFRIFDILLLLLWWFTPAFMMRWFNIDQIPMNIALILFLTLIEALPCREYKIFRPGKYLFPAERILCSIREYTSFLTRMKCIPVKNEVYSRKEWSWFS